GRLLIIRRDDFDVRARVARGDQARNVDEADLGAAGGDGADRIRRPLRWHDGDVQAFVFEIAFAERDVPGGVASQADKVEHEFEVALLHLPGGRVKSRNEAESSEYACDQRSRHVWLLNFANSSRPRSLTNNAHPSDI